MTINKLRIIQFIPEFIVSGGETMCANLCIGLKEKGHEVLAVSLFNYQSSLTELLNNKGIEIKYLDKKPGFDISIFGKIKKIIKEFKPDVIHTHLYIMNYVMPIANNLGIKVKIHTVHSVASREQSSIRKIYAYYAYHYKNVKPIALSKEIQKTICEEYELEEENVPIVFNGEDTNHIKKKEDYSFKTFNILHVGRFVELKNQLMIVEVIERLINEGLNIKMTFTGNYENDYGQKVREYVKERRLESAVVFKGIVNGIEKVFSEADIFVLPSKFEGMPMTIIEAMSAAMPIIASNVGGIKDMLTNDCNAILINPNKEELYKAIKELYFDIKKREFLGNNAYKEKNKYSRENMASAYESEYFKILKKGAEND